MFHPMCGGNLRRATKIVAFGDAILTGLIIIVAGILMYCFFNNVRTPEISAYAIGSVILFIGLMSINVYLAFRLYRSAHERNVERLKQYRDSALIILPLCTILVLVIHHTADPKDPRELYPLLWFYVLCIVAAVFRAYMYMVVKAFLEEFQLP